jgi:hypothetical protein
MRPNITEHFWGYEVRPNEHVIDVAVLTRAVCGVLTVAMFIAAFGVWLMPAIAFTGSPFLAKVGLSIVLLLAAVLLGRIAARGTRVRLQIDTTSGELREVVDGPMGAIVTLSSFGIDAVEGVDVVASEADRSFGQVQIRLRDQGKIPAGDGAISALHALRNRLASDCGVEQHDPSRVPVWGGPLAA